MSLFKVYFAFFKFVILSNLSQATCPPNSTPGTNNGKCYSFFDTQGDFNAAERDCTEVGGHLVSICNAFENNILAEVAVGKLQAYGAKDFWIGYNDQFSKGVWNWTSNSNCTYLNWNGGEY
uniref:C-type lectin domain-containing protein n=1 Tax=Acrobeloides nanus TaxID=290746 RepID=A0A914CX32_9BILA